MARSIPKTKTLKSEDRLILRAIYYQQGLPITLLSSGTSLVPQRLKAFEMSGLIGRDGQIFRLTDTGVSVLKSAYGVRKPPLVDFKSGARLDRGEIKEEFIVGSAWRAKLRVRLV